MSSRVEEQLTNMTAVIREQCREAGLRTDGSSDVLVERWTNYCETRELRQQVEKLSTRKRERIDKHEQRRLDVNLWNAAKTGSAAQVLEALQAGANVNYACEDRQYYPLIRACRRYDDWDVAAAVVEVLIAHGASVLQPSLENVTPLHWAASHSNVKVAAILLENGARIDADDDGLESPVCYAARRLDDEAPAMVEFFISQNANYTGENRDGRNPLMIAAQEGTANVVRVILSHSSVETPGGDTNNLSAIVLATENILHGGEIIPLLMDAHRDDPKDDPHPYGTPNIVGGNNAMAHAIRCGNTAAVKALKRCVQGFTWEPTCGSSAFHSGGGDPLGIADEAAECGISVTPTMLLSYEMHRMPKVWAYLRRAGTPDVAKLFAALKYHGHESTWYWIALEMPNMRHPIEGCTLMHLAAEYNNYRGIDVLCSLWANPFLRDAKGRLPVDVTKDKDIRKQLHEYMHQAPRLEVIRWYGPFLYERAEAWMCCVVHWRVNRIRNIPKDVARMVLQRVMALEYV